ncbi:MAG: carboxypeptidase-like regulatory domain-containing protein [Pyrinomonadaceae bacterium]|nr:carboxypeptidase-like regulatory domain-containing protein [Pyrinomonadaceae bacterium]
MMRKNILFNAAKVFAPAFLVALFFTFSAKAALTQIGTADSTNLTDTLSFTVPAGSNRVLVVIVSDADATSVASVDFGGLPLISRVQHSDGTAVDSMWTLSLGTSVTASTQNITVVSTGATPNTCQFIGAISFEGVDQGTPLTGIQTADTFGSSVSSSLNVVSKAGDLVLDIFDTFDTTPNGTRTPGSGQTIQHSQENVFIGGGGIPGGFWNQEKNSTAQLGSSYGFYNTSTKAGAGVVNMSWASDDTAMIHIAANVNSLAPTAAGVAISGRAVTADGKGIKNATVYLTDQEGNIRTAMTGSFGNYTFENVQSGADYVLTIVGKRVVFNNPTRLLNVQSEISNEDFVAENY